MGFLGSLVRVCCKFIICMKQNFSTKHDSFFPRQTKIIAVMLCLTVVGLPLGLIMLYAEQGASFKPDEKLYRHYIGLFGLHFGKWESYENYPDMALLSQRMTTTSFSRSNRQTDQTEVAHELYLLSPDHRKKILAYVFKNLDAAETDNPKLLADNLGVNFTTYSPKVSAQTAARRRR